MSLYWSFQFHCSKSRLRTKLFLKLPLRPLGARRLTAKQSPPHGFHIGETLTLPEGHERNATGIMGKNAGPRDPNAARGEGSKCTSEPLN